MQTQSLTVPELLERDRLTALEMIFNKLNAICCNCIIGRGAEFGPGLVLIHSTGVVINGQVRGGSGIHIEHQVTIGAERNQSPILGDQVFVGAGAKIIGPVTVGSDVRIGANAVVVDDIPAGTTAVDREGRVLVVATGTLRVMRGMDYRFIPADVRTADRSRRSSPGVRRIDTISAYPSTSGAPSAAWARSAAMSGFSFSGSPPTNSWSFCSFSSCRVTLTRSGGLKRIVFSLARGTGKLGDTSSSRCLSIRRHYG